MLENDFIDGYLVYEVCTEPVPRFELSEWSDGYLAFSNAERRLSELKSVGAAPLLAGRVLGIDGVEGYLMEVNIWRCRDGVYEELSVEREDRGFYVQRWRLETREPAGKSPNCYFRPAPTKPRKNSGLFSEDDLRSVEVVCPETRLQFFITCGGSKG
jgi:hypothetical protein